MQIGRREAIAGMGASVASLLPLQVGATSPGSSDLSFVHPDLRPAVEAMRESFGGETHLTLECLEAFRRSPLPETKPPLGVAKRSIAGAAGGAPVVIYIVNVRPGRKRGGILYMHGGGYVLGSAGQDIATCQELAASLDCTVISVDYRLAPEARYCASLEDNYAALRWVYQNGRDLGIDPLRIALVGESAGGGHAALLAIAARDRREVPVAFQCLVYPMLDDRTGSTRSVPAPIGSLVWTAEVNRFGWHSFLGREPGHPEITAGVAGREKTVSGLPPAWIGVGGIDLFVEEDMAFAARLIAAGIPAELTVVPGAYHAFQYFAPATRVAKTFKASMLAALQAALA